MSEEIKDLHDKISLLDDKFDNLHTQQALISQSIGQMADSLEKLVDLRAETISILKAQEQNQREHDEIFARLRKGEVTQVACKKSHEATTEKIEGIKEVTTEKIEDIKEERIKPMEDNQKWVIRVVIGAIILAVIALVTAHV